MCYNSTENDLSKGIEEEYLYFGKGGRMGGKGTCIHMWLVTILA